MTEWRVGRHYGVHVYEGDRPVATFFTVDDARRAVDDHNRAEALRAQLAESTGEYDYEIN
jgi:hypothetical protein